MVSDVDAPPRVVLRFLDERLKKELSALAVALTYEERFSVLPELHAVFGEEALIKFLDIFAGRTIQVPARDVLERRFRAVRIWAVLTAHPQAGASLAREYGITTAQVAQIYRDTAVLLDAAKIGAHDGTR